jgi:hypothetical protein
MNDKCGYHLYCGFHQKLYLPPVETVPMSVWVQFLQVQVWEIPILYHFNNKFNHKFSCGYPELNLFAKLSLSQVAYEHVIKEGTYLLLLNVILILNIFAFCMPVMQCSQMPFCYKQTVPWHTLISHFHLIFRAMNLCHELEKLLSQITPA